MLTLALFMVVGGGGAGNPKTTSSIFSALQASGQLRQVAAPVACVGLGLVVVGLITGVLAGRRNEP